VHFRSYTGDPINRRDRTGLYVEDPDEIGGGSCYDEATNSYQYCDGVDGGGGSGDSSDSNDDGNGSDDNGCTWDTTTNTLNCPSDPGQGPTWAMPGAPRWNPSPSQRFNPTQQTPRPSPPPSPLPGTNEPPPEITSDPSNSPWGKWFTVIQALKKFIDGIAGGSIFPVISVVPRPNCSSRWGSGPTCPLM